MSDYKELSLVVPMLQPTRDVAPCTCIEPVRVCPACGEPKSGMWCRACRDHYGTECATCGREVADA